MRWGSISNLVDLQPWLPPVSFCTWLLFDLWCKSKHSIRRFIQTRDPSWTSANGFERSNNNSSCEYSYTHTHTHIYIYFYIYVYAYIHTYQRKLTLLWPDRSDKGCCLQHTGTHCNIMQHTATYCSTLQRAATHQIKAVPPRMTKVRWVNPSAKGGGWGCKGGCWKWEKSS